VNGYVVVGEMVAGGVLDEVVDVVDDIGEVDVVVEEVEVVVTVVDDVVVVASIIWREKISS
jgi:hypothetical protein